MPLPLTTVFLVCAFLAAFSPHNHTTIGLIFFTICAFLNEFARLLFTISQANIKVPEETQAPERVRTPIGDPGPGEAT